MLVLNKLGDDDWVFDDPRIDFPAHEKLDSAMDLYHSGEPEKAESELKELIADNPLNIDAFHHLSMVYQRIGLSVEAYLCCREAVRIGFSIIPNNFSWRSSKLEWGHLNNRPFLRAYHNLGLWLESRGEVDDAIQVFVNMLSVCQSDNIGVRYILPKLWLETGDLLSIVRLNSEFSDDYSPEFMYNRALALALLGETKKAEKAVQIAKSEFPLVANEIKKKHHQKPTPKYDGFVTNGSPEQAYEYWSQYGTYWKNSQDAMKLL
jgi:tetratricopeptide (TPR) repeat protein